MKGFCGWLGSGDEAGDSAALLTNMVRGLDPFRTGRSVVGSSNRGGGIGALENGADLWSDDHVNCAVAGRPNWSDPALAEIARTSGHAKAFAEGYHLYSDIVFDRIHGAFSVALIDTQAQEALVAIDRMGIQPLAYARGTGGLFVFGATTDAVRQHPGIAATISPQAIYNYLFNYIVASPATIYQEQQKLLPGQFVRVTRGRFEKKFYWEMPYLPGKTLGGDNHWIERLWAVLDKSFSKSIEGVDPKLLGAFLSGGLDSSTVSGLLARYTGSARTFTIGFREPQFDESDYARLAARHFATEHHEYFVTPHDVVELMPKIAEVYDEPYGNTSAVPAFYCAKMARESGVAVMLAGDGGDEIFAGNERYAYMKKIEHYGRLPAWFRKLLLEPALNLPGLSRLGPVRKGLRLAERYATPMPERIYAHNYLADGSPEQILNPELLRVIDLDEPMALAREAYFRPKSASMLQRMMHLDLKITLADNDLRKVNLMCELAGVEVRYPFLEDELVTFSASVPSSLLLPGVKLRDFFKKAMRGFLPDEILTKQKHGFGLPFEVWIKTDKELQTLVLDQISACRRRNYLRPEFLEQVSRGCQTSEPTPTDGMAWDIAMLEMWLQKHNDRNR